MVYFRKILNSFLVWDASLFVTVGSRQCLDVTVGKIENGLERVFVKHRLNCLLITDPYCHKLLKQMDKGVSFYRNHGVASVGSRNECLVLSTELRK